MYTRQHSRQYKISNKGVTLVELLIVMVVAGILASIAIPSFRDITANNELTIAQEDLGQMLRKARSLAQARSTFSNVLLSQTTPATAVLTLQDGSFPTANSASQTITLPSSVSVANGTATFTFDSIGNRAGATSTVLSSTTITATRTINVSPLGSLELLRN